MNDYNQLLKYNFVSLYYYVFQKKTVIISMKFNKLLYSCRNYFQGQKILIKNIKYLF
jgi:hypothetical protein